MTVPCARAALTTPGDNERDLLSSGYIIAHARCDHASVIRVTGIPPHVILPWWAIGDYREEALGKIIADELRHGYGRGAVATLLATAPATVPATQTVPAVAPSAGRVAGH